MIGPFRGGRVNGVTGVPGQPNVFYMGSVGGGVWKTTNAGRTWLPIFDSQPIASIGAVAVAPSRPDVVYVGTGEADMRSQISYGNGMYKSTDAGKTWTHIGLEPTRPDRQGRRRSARPECCVRGCAWACLWREPGSRRLPDARRRRRHGRRCCSRATTSARLTWPSIRATRRPLRSPVEHPPSAMEHLSALVRPGQRTLQIDRRRANWQQLTSGLPSDGVGRIGIAVAPTNRSRVYAIVDAKAGGLYRSDDAGATWRLASSDSRIWGRGWYFGKVTVDPKNADLVYVMNTGAYRSRTAAGRLASRSRDRQAATTTTSSGFTPTTATG
jgi:hypothetical protein